MSDTEPATEHPCICGTDGGVSRAADADAPFTCDVNALATRIAHACTPTKSRRVVSELTVFGDDGRGQLVLRADKITACVLRPIINMTPVHESRVVARTCDERDAVHVRVILAQTTGWDIEIEIGGRVAAIAHCTEWHRVERLCSELERPMADRHTAPSARR